MDWQKSPARSNIYSELHTKSKVQLRYITNPLDCDQFNNIIRAEGLCFTLVTLLPE